MTPAARVAAAAEILDAIIEGTPAEQVLTGWARRSRFAGSGDRAAIRDLVFEALRCRRSFGWLGGGDNGRALMLGRTRAAGDDPDALYTGLRHALAPLSELERSEHQALDEAPRSVCLDVPDWMQERLDNSLGDSTDAILAALRNRAPVMLRVNPARTTREAVIEVLAAEGIEATTHGLAPHAIEILTPTRKLAAHDLYHKGHFEFQDVASQAAVEALAEYVSDAQVLDYCAGGGGKSLALAAVGARRVVAHDAIARRLKDLPERAERAGVSIAIEATPKGPFDVVVCDVPCSGSGAWRRQPDAKWRMTEENLDALTATQAEIVDAALPLVASSGHLVYMTCSLLRAENEDAVEAALERHGHLNLVKERRFSPLEGCDGFYVAVFRCDSSAR